MNFSAYVELETSASVQPHPDRQRGDLQRVAVSFAGGNRFVVDRRVIFTDSRWCIFAQCRFCIAFDGLVAAQFFDSFFSLFFVERLAVPAVFIGLSSGNRLLFGFSDDHVRLAGDFERFSVGLSMASDWPSISITACQPKPQARSRQIEEFSHHCLAALSRRFSSRMAIRLSSL
ncbi:MAG: hypothetical protein U0105_07800 [Candidatus Obscuribacterales bacterium]